MNGQRGEGIGRQKRERARAKIMGIELLDHGITGEKDLGKIKYG